MAKIKVTLVKSTIACLKKHKQNVEALGLTKIGTFRVHEDNAAIRGMIAKVSHLVKVDSVEN